MRRASPRQPSLLQGHRTPYWLNSKTIPSWRRPCLVGATLPAAPAVRSAKSRHFSIPFHRDDAPGIDFESRSNNNQSFVKVAHRSSITANEADFGDIYEEYEDFEERYEGKYESAEDFAEYPERSPDGTGEAASA